MAYIRKNNVSGKVSSTVVSLSLNGTTATWNGNPGIPVITSPDRMKITVAGGTAQEEILEISAHAANATSATVVRNTEATQNGQNSGAAHSGVDWSHAPTVGDFLLAGSSDFEDAVRDAMTLDQITGPAAKMFFGGEQLGTLGVGTATDDAATVGQTAGSKMPFVISGCVWTADASGSTLLGSMSAGVIEIKGQQLTVAAQAHHTFTASKDTYVDLRDNGDGTASVTYTAVANNQLSPALAGTGTAMDTLRCAIIISTGTALTTGNGINQGFNSANGTTGATTTVAAGSNGNTINTTTLSVAANSLAPSGLARVDTNKGAGDKFATVIKYTGGGGTTTLTGVTVFSGDVSGTVATGGAVAQIAQWYVCDSNGNRIYPTTPNTGLIGLRSTDITGGTTTVTTVNLATMSVPFIVPAGPNRLVKISISLSLLGSSATSGSLSIIPTVDSNPALCPGNRTLGTGTTAQQETWIGELVCAPGSHIANVQVQVSAGTLTLGASFRPSEMRVELV